MKLFLPFGEEIPYAEGSVAEIAELYCRILDGGAQDPKQPEPKPVSEELGHFRGPGGSPARRKGVGGRPRIGTPDQVARAIGLVLDGESFRAVGEKVGVSLYAVQSWTKIGRKLTTMMRSA